MAMTNEQIVLIESLKLMNNGTIGTTGKVIQLQMMDGSIIETLEPEPIHTFQAWKAMGYKVKKGSTAIAKFPIWNFRNGSREIRTTDSATGNVVVKTVTTKKCYMKNASWFTAGQVEKIA